MKNAVQADRTPRVHGSAGFSLLEMLVSVLIIGVIMSAVFAFMYQAQKRFQGTVVSSESNQGARGALEVMTQEVGQAGFNPNWFTTTGNASSTLNYRLITALPLLGNAAPQCVTLYDSSGAGLTNSNLNINAGDWLNVDSGASNEQVQVYSTTMTPVPTGFNCTTIPTGANTYNYSCPCPLGSAGSAPPGPAGCGAGYTNPCQIKAIFSMDHTAAPTGMTGLPVLSYKFAYPTGIVWTPTWINNGSAWVYGAINGQGPVAAWNTQVNTPKGTPTTSNDDTLELYGDVLQNGQIYYVVYSLSPTTSPATTVTISDTCKGALAQETYTLYNLYRSATPVTYPASLALDTNNQASPLVQNVLYYLPTATVGLPTPPSPPTAPPAAATGYGPTCQPIFGYPNSFAVGFVPNQITVIGTIVVNLSVAVNPQALETGIVQWYTMATQIRPLNLAAAVAVNQIGGYKFLPKAPLDLPMIYPTSPTYYP